MRELPSNKSFKPSALRYSNKPAERACQFVASATHVGLIQALGIKMTSARSKDDLVTAAAIGLLAYLSADVGHHVLGHGVACLALGGTINSISSVFVNCTIRGAVIDLAGPTANLVVGLAALALVAGRRYFPRSLSLFLLLAAAFNLFWFALQLVFSAATMTDDWAWPIHYYGIPNTGRYGMIAIGAVGYWLTVRAIGARLDFPSRSRAMYVVTSAWVAAGVIACVTAALDRHPSAAILQHAAPQSLLLAIGLLFTPSASPNNISDSSALVIARSWYWITAAAVASVLSVLFLGPGFAISL